MLTYIDKWPALSSDPDKLNQLLVALGVPLNIRLEDTYLLDDIDDSILAIIIIYPESNADELAKAAEERQREHVKLDVQFIKQTIDNACGIFAIIHAVLNSDARKDIMAGSILHQIAEGGFKATEELKRIYYDTVGEDIEDNDDEINHHFTTLIGIPTHPGQGSTLVELDGERQSAYIRGTSEGRCLSDVNLIRKEFRRLTNSKDTDEFVSAGMLKLVRVYQCS